MASIISILALEWHGTLLLLGLWPLAATWVAIAEETSADAVLTYES